MVAETTCQRTPTMPDTIAKLATLNVHGQYISYADVL